MRPIIEQLRRINLVFKSIVLLTLFLRLSTPLFSQSNYSNLYCSGALGMEIDFETTPGKLYTTYSENDEGVVIRIINSSDRSQCLFSSYFENKYYSSKFLHRVDKGLGEYKLSFLPLIPYLSTKPTDKQIIGSERLVNKGQILYDFIELVPNSYYEMKIGYDSFEVVGDLVCDFKPHELNKFEPIKFKYVKSNKIKKKLGLVFEFAVYQDVSLLCKESAYYLEEHEFDTSSKAFEIVSIPAKFKNHNHPLF